MIQFGLITFSIWAFQVFLGAYTVIFHVGEFPLALYPAVLVYGSFWATPLATLVWVIFSGLVIDGLLAIPLGVHLVIGLVLWFLCQRLVQWLGKPNTIMVWVSIWVCSQAYRFLFVPAYYVFTKKWGQVDWMTCLWAPFLDATIGLGCMRVWDWVFALLKVNSLSREDTFL